MKIPLVDNPRKPRRRVWAIAIALLAVITAGAAVAVVFAWPEADPDRVWEHALREFELGHWDRTESDLARLGGMRSPTPRDRMLRAKLLLARNQSEGALNELAVVPDADPMASQARMVAGQIESKRGRLPDAERLLLASLALDPRQTQARRELIFIYGTQLRRREVDEQFQALARQVALPFDDLFVWALSHSVSWDPKIRQELTQYLAADPKDRWSRLALAEVYRRLKWLKEAEATLEGLSEADTEAMCLRARLAIERLDFEKAASLLERAPTEHAGLARLRGAIAMRNRDFSAAVHHYETAFRLEPHDREGIASLAQALLLRGDEEASKPYFERLRAYDKLARLIDRAGTPEGREDTTLPRRLGIACAEAGRIEESRSWYQLAITINPLDKEAQQALFHSTADSASDTDKTPANTLK